MQVPQGVAVAQAPRIIDLPKGSPLCPLCLCGFGAGITRAVASSATWPPRTLLRGNRFDHHAPARGSVDRDVGELQCLPDQRANLRPVEIRGGLQPNVPDDIARSLEQVLRVGDVWAVLKEAERHPSWKDGEGDDGLGCAFMRCEADDERIVVVVHEFDGARHEFPQTRAGGAGVSGYRGRESTQEGRELIAWRCGLAGGVASWSYRLPGMRERLHLMGIRIVRLGSPRATGEGPRLGTVRRPPRGVKKADYASLDFFDVWLPELSAPSNELFSWARRQAVTARRWQQFETCYRREMQAPAARHLVETLAALSHQSSFSVGCYCEDETRCHRGPLRELLAAAGASINNR